MGQIMSATLVDLTLAKPPLPPFAAEELARTLVEIATDRSIGGLLDGHRYEGTEDDREAGQKWLSSRFRNKISVDRIIVTNGTKSAVLSLLSLLLRPGDAVATEQLSSLGIWSIPQILGARHVGLPIDEHGIVPDSFLRLCRDDPPRVLFVVPTLNNPTTTTWPENRRREIAEIARKYGVLIVEDDICGRLPSGAPYSIASLAPDITWLATGLAKSVGTGMRVGYIVAPDHRHASRFTTRFKALSNWHPAPLMAEIATKWINDGTAEKVLAAVRAELAVRQNHAATVFKDVYFRSSPESLFLWLPLERVGDGLVEALKRKNIAVRTIAPYAVGMIEPPHALRLCLGSMPSADELNRALGEIRNMLLC